MRDLQKAPWPGWNTIRLIGQGSFGTVYEIRRELIDGTVEAAAMKVLTIPQNPSDVTEMYSEGYDEESITATFQAHLRSIVAEYTLMRKLDGSANVVNCKDISYIQHDDGIGWDIYIRMELLTSLLKSLPEHIDEKTAVKIGRDICSALVLCKKYGIIHRDIKPQNIFASVNGDYKLGDFGIAKTVEKTMGGTKIGTYKYMAPEVYNNQPYGSAADIYSLGLVMYWLLNERRMPFMPLPPAKILAGQDEAARQRRLSGESLLTPAHGSTELKRIVLKACAYDPKERYHTADEMLADLDALGGERVFAKLDEKALEDDATEITDVTSEETVGVFGTGRGRMATAEADDYSCQIENETAQTVGVKWKNESEETQLAEKPSKKRKHLILPIAAAVILICAVGGIYGYTHFWFGHIWEAADCTVPATYTHYGSTSGSALERKKSETTLPENNAAIAGTLQPHPTGANYSGVRFSVFDSSISRSEIHSISFLGSKDLAPFFAWDVSEEQDGSVVAWVEGDSGNYKLYIAANGRIRARSCKELFAFYLNAEKIEFNGVLDTSQATDMFRMFQGCDNLTSLDLSSFDTSRVTEMSEMFDSCGKLSNLNLSGFNTSRVENMIGMFRGCQKLTRLDLSNFDFSNVRYYDEFMNEDATVNGMPWKRLFS